MYRATRECLQLAANKSRYHRLQLASNVIANRMSKVISKLVSKVQAGYLKSRSSSEVIKALNDSLEYLNLNIIPGMLIAIDNENAFDSVSREVMKYCLAQCYFERQFVQWVNTY